MTSLLLAALLVLAASPALLRWRLGPGWLVRPYTVLVLVACLYHGISEVVIRLTGAEQYANYRVERNLIDQGAMVAAVGLLLMTIGYLVVVGRHPEPPAPVDRAVLARVLDWRLLALLTAPLLIATVAGQGYATGEALQGEGLGVTGFANQFLVSLALMTALGLLLRWPTLFAPIAVVLCIALALAGQRLEVVLSVGVLSLLGARVGLRPSWRSLTAVALVAGVAVFAISSLRGAGQRDIFYSDTGVSARLDALGEALRNPQSETVYGGGTLVEAALRLDSNTWSGAITSALRSDVPPMGRTPLVDSVKTAVPSFLFEEKVETLTVSQRNPEVAQIEGMKILYMDYLPGHVTSFLGALGFGGLVVFNLLLGALLGAFDKAALRRSTPVALIALLLLTQAAFFYERGLTYYLLMGRAFLVIAVAVVVWSQIRELVQPRPSAVQRKLQTQEPVTGRR